MAAAEHARFETLIRARPHEPGGPWFVEIGDKSSSPEVFGPYANPAVAEKAAQRLREGLKRVLHVE